MGSPDASSTTSPTPISSHPGERMLALPAGVRRIGAVALPALVLGGAFVHAAAASWRKWGNLVSDGGRELELPRRLLAGESLYVDVRCYYGPLAPWLNAALYRAFGVHADVLLFAGLASAALLALALWLLARRFMGAAAATLAVLPFAHACAFPHLASNPAFNFAFPYAYASTYGMVAAAWSLLFLVRHAQEGRERDLAWSCAFLALAALAKVEVLFAAGAAHAAWAAAALGGRRLGRRHLAWYGAAGAAVLAVYGALAWRVGGGLWRDNLGAVLNPANERFQKWVAGLDHPAHSLALAGRSALALAAAAAVTAVAALVARGRRSPVAARWLACAAAFAATLELYRRLPVTLTFRALPFLAAAALAVVAARAWRSEAARASLAPRLALWAFALACFARVPLHATAEHYGFFLLPVPLVALAILLLRDAPALAGAAPWGPRAVQAAAAGLLAGVAIQHHAASAPFYARHVHPLETPRGRLLVPDPLQPELVGLLASFPRGTRVLAVPLGEGLVFFAGQESADGMLSHVPPDFTGGYSDERVLERWRARPPGAVLWIRAPMTEFGFRGFGEDYAQRSAAWLAAAYRVAAEDPTGGVAVLVPRR